MGITIPDDEELDQEGQQTSGNPYLDTYLKRQGKTPAKPTPTVPSPSPPVQPGTPPRQQPTDFNPYYENYLRRRDGQRGRLEAQLGQAPDMAPSRAKFILDQSRQTGVPPDLIHRNPEMFAQTTPPDVSRYMAESPSLAEWLSAQDEVTTAAVKHDLGVLSGVGGTIAASARALPASVWMLRASLAGEILKWSDVANVLQSDIRSTADRFAPGPTLGERFGQLSDFSNVVQTDLRIRMYQLAQGLVSGERPPGWPLTGVSREVNQITQAVGQAKTDLAGLIPDQPTAGPVKELTYLSQFASVANSLAQKKAEEVQGDLSQLRPYQRAIVSGFASAGQVLQLMPFGQAGILAGFYLGTSGQEYPQGRKAGLGVYETAGYSTLQGAVEVLTEILPTHYFTDLIKTNKGMLNSLWKMYASELGGEQIATAWQDYNTWSAIEKNQGKTWEQFLQERPGRAYETLVSSIVTTTLMAGGARLAARTLEKAGELAEKSTTVKDVPHVAVEAFNAQAKGTPVQDVYIDPQMFTEYLQGKGVDPVEMATTLTGNPKALADSLETNQPLKLPFGTYTTYIASKPELRSMGDEVRFANSKGELSATANEERAVSAQFDIGEASEAAGTATTPAADAAPASRPIYESFLAELTAKREGTAENRQTTGGAIPLSIATKYAELMEAAYTNLAKPLGLNPVALYEASKLRVTREAQSIRQQAESGQLIDPATGQVVAEAPAKPSLLQRVKQFFQPLKNKQVAPRTPLMQDAVDQWVTSTQTQFGEALPVLDVRATPTGLSLESINVAKTESGRGIGTAALQSLIAFADQHQQRITITLPEKGYQPDTRGAKATSRERLAEFYARFGFVKNQGRNKDFSESISTSMYRDPRPQEYYQRTKTTIPKAPDYANAAVALAESAGIDPSSIQSARARAAARISAAGAGGRDHGVTPGLPGASTPDDLANTYQQRTQTESAAFKAWFGSSVVVDAHGDPLVVYHGTSDVVSAFNVSAGAETSGYGIPAAFFTDDPSVAASYAFQRQTLADKQALIANERAQHAYDAAIAAVWDRIKNHEDATFPPERPENRWGWMNDMLDRGVIDRATHGELMRLGDLSTESEDFSGPLPWESGYREHARPNTLPVYLSLQHPKVVDANGMGWETVMATVMPTIDHTVYDGAIFKNVRDAGDNSESVSTVFAAFRPEQIKSAIGNQGAFDSNNPNILFSSSDNEARAALRLDQATMARTMVLFKGKDKSSVFHESAHLFFDVFTDIAQQLLSESAPTPEQAKQLADFQTLLKWTGYDGTVEDWAGLSVDEKRPHHEKFAEGFETYLRTGKAPSKKLQSTFAAARSWFLKLAKHLWTTVEFSPEVRDVVGRMLASDQEIQAVMDEEALQPLIRSLADAQGLGWTKEQYDAYTAKVAALPDEARAVLSAQVVSELDREETAEWKERKAEIRQVVEAETYQTPVYRALSAITKGETPAGQPFGVGGPMPMDRASLVKLIGEDRVQRLPRNFTTTEHGLDPRIVADQFGFVSPEALVQAMESAPPMARAIASETNARMLQEHGSILTNGTMRQEAEAAMVTETATDIVHDELAVLHEKQKTRPVSTTPAILRGVPTKDFFERDAARRLKGKTVKDLQPHLYWTAARKASRVALEAAGKDDIETAILEKNRELLNLEMFKQAVAFQKGVEKAIPKWRRMFKPDAEIAKSRTMEIVLAARALAAPLIGTERQQDKVSDALEVLKKYDPQSHEFVQNTLGGFTDTSPLKERTVDEVLALTKVIDGLWTMARRDQQQLIDGKLLQRKAIQAELADGLERHGGGAYQAIGLGGQPTTLRKWQEQAVGAKAWLRRVESWVTAMDGGKTGPFRTYIWNPVRERVTAYRVAKVEALRAYKAILDPIQETLTAEKIDAPEIGYTFGQDGSGGMIELLGAMLHIGNRNSKTSNLAKLMLGVKRSDGRTLGRWADEAHTQLDTADWDRFLDRMHAEGRITKIHYDYLQGVWDLFESYKGDLQQAHKETVGTFFEEVPADAFQTPFGLYRGGYVPAMSDPLVSKQAAVRSEKEQTFESGLSFILPSAGLRSTISRVETGEAQSLAINLTFIPQHLDWVLRFSHIQPAVKDVTRLITDKEFRSVLNSFDPGAAEDLLTPWLSRAATQRVTMKGQSTTSDKVWTALRKRTGMQALAFSVTNFMQQYTGPLVALGTRKVKARYLANAMYRLMLARKETTQTIMDASPFMQTFMTSQAMDLLDDINEILLNPSVYGVTANWLQKHNQILAVTSQGQVNKIVWIAAKDQAEVEGHHGIDAVRIADSAVRESQGSPFAEDLSRFEANTPFMKSLSMFSSYFITLLNAQTSEVGNQLRSDKPMAIRVGRAAATILLAHVMTSAISQSILNALRGDWDDDDDDTHIDEILNLLFGSSAQTAFSMIPIVGPSLKALYGSLLTDQAYDDDIRISPILSMAGTATKSGGRALLALFSDEVELSDAQKRQAALDALNVLGVALNLPLGGLKKPLGFLFDVESGKQDAETALDYALGLVTGKSRRDQ